MRERAPIVQVQDLVFAYPGRPVFTAWSACIGAGATLVQGEEGSGKTSLLRLLAHDLQPQGGQVLWAAGAAPAGAVFWVSPRSPALDATTVRAWLQGLPAQYPGWDAQALAAHLDGFALHTHEDKTFHMLSAGTRRKVLMAGALASGAALTLIDEPVAGLDKASVRYLEQALAVAAQAPGRALVVAHYEPLPGVPWDAVLALAAPAFS